MWILDDRTMPREHLHTRQCLAAAVSKAMAHLVAVDTDHDFRLDLQDRVPLAMADNDLADNVGACQCPDEHRIATLRAMGYWTTADQARYDADRALVEQAEARAQQRRQDFMTTVEGN